MKYCIEYPIIPDQHFRRTMLLGRILMTPDDYEGKKQLRIAFRDKVRLILLHDVHMHEGTWHDVTIINNLIKN